MHTDLEYVVENGVIKWEIGDINGGAHFRSFKSNFNFWVMFGDDNLHFVLQVVPFLASLPHVLQFSLKYHGDT